MGGHRVWKTSQNIAASKKCIRNVYCKGPRSHTDPMFSKLNILKLQDIFLLNSLLFVHKLNNEMLLVSFDNFLTLLRNPNRSNGYELIKLKNDYLDKFPTFFLPKTWNEQKFILKLEASHKKLKRIVIEGFIDRYPSKVKCKDRACNDCFP